MAKVLVGIHSTGLVRSKQATGLERYLQQLITHLAVCEHYTSIELHLYFPNRLHFEAHRAFLNSLVSQAKRRVCVHVAPVWRGWYNVGLGLAMLASRLDVFHFTVPRRAKFCQVPSIVTVFDIAALSLALTLVQKEQNYLLEMVKTIQSVVGAIAISENTKAQLAHQLKRHDATVIPLGVNLEQFQPATVETIIALNLDFTHRVV